MQPPLLFEKRIAFAFYTLVVLLEGMSRTAHRASSIIRAGRDQRIPYRVLLSVLTAVFASRVIMQAVAGKWNVAGLPPFEAWHSETMPYAVLLSLQLIILLLMVFGCLALPRLDTNRKTCVILAVIGWIYGALMVSRMAIGILDLSDHDWFDGAVPTAFHFVLVFYLLIMSHAFSDGKSKAGYMKWSRYVGYPLLIAGSCILLFWMMQSGAPPIFASYVAVLIGVLGVIFHESFNPARDEWRPEARDVFSDGVFLIVVQVGIPAVLKILLPAAVITLAGNSAFTTLDFWPHAWPVLAQVGLMLLVAEFFRYWIHRSMHEFNPLWKLHAVHHASDKLYTINVGRFHPLDKAIQFLGDSLPFLLLGVGPDVFAAYFVFYAVNGFYQHSNADVRLGWLNWIVAGPELHRWHHSTVICEGHANYGNNLIIWDACFGTRLLPHKRTVAEVGIGNKKWPRGFLSQIVAPLTQPTERDPDQ